MVEPVSILVRRVFLPHWGHWFQQERPHDLIDFLPHDSHLQAMQISRQSRRACFTPESASSPVEVAEMAAHLWPP